jgi:hypothetical protein
MIGHCILLSYTDMKSKYKIDFKKNGKKGECVESKKKNDRLDVTDTLLLRKMKSDR